MMTDGCAVPDVDSFRKLVLETANRLVSVPGGGRRRRRVPLIEALLIDLGSLNCQRRIQTITFIRLVRAALVMSDQAFAEAVEPHQETLLKIAQSRPKPRRQRR